MIEKFVAYCLLGVGRATHLIQFTRNRHEARDKMRKVKLASASSGATPPPSMLRQKPLFILPFKSFSTKNLPPKRHKQRMTSALLGPRFMKRPIVLQQSPWAGPTIPSKSTLAAADVFFSIHHRRSR